MTAPSGSKPIANMTEADLRSLIRSIVLEELVASVGGTSYVGNLHGFEIGQRVVLSAKGMKKYRNQSDLEARIVTPLRSDNELGFLTIEDSTGRQYLVSPDEIEAKGES